VNKLGFMGRLAVGLSVVALVASCSSSSSGKAATPAGGGSSAAAGSGLAAAKVALAKAEDTKGLVFPKPPSGTFDPGVHKVAIISDGQGGVGDQQMSAFAQDAAKAIGWQASPTFDGQFSPSIIAQGVQQALNQGYDAIILASVDAASISSAVDAAVAKGVPIACIMCQNPTFAGKVMDATTEGRPGGEALAAYIATTLNGKGNVVGFNDKSFPIVATRMDGIKDGLSRYCPACNFKEDQFPTTDLSKPGPPTWTGFLAANPPGSVQFVAGPYDFFSMPAAKTLQQSGRTDIKLSGFDSWSQWAQAIASGNPASASATIAAPFQYCGWAAMDLVARAVTKQPTWDAATMPVAVVDKSNATQFSTGYLVPPFSVPDMFKTAWGKS
jgi:ABC-type sugar transport system substrate-binding protein